MKFKNLDSSVYISTTDLEWVFENRQFSRTQRRDRRRLAGSKMKMDWDQIKRGDFLLIKIMTSHSRARESGPEKLPE